MVDNLADNKWKRSGIYTREQMREWGTDVQEDVGNQVRRKDRKGRYECQDL